MILEDTITIMLSLRSKNSGDFKNSMNEVQSKIEALQPAIFARRIECANPTRKFRVFSYKLALLLHDVAIVFFGCLLGVWMTIPDYFIIAWYPEITLLAIVNLITISYYSPQGLYNYHLIYSRKYHVLGQLRAASLGFLSLLLAYGLYFAAAYLPEMLFVLFLAILATGIIALSRTHGDGFLNFLRAVGISVLVIGTVDLVGRPGNFFLLQHWQPIFLSFLTTTLVLMLTRFFLVSQVFSTWLRKHFRRQVIIVGSNDEAKRIASHIIERNAPFYVTGVVSTGTDQAPLNASVCKDCLGAIHNLPNIVENHRVEEIIVTDESIDKKTLILLLDYCTSIGINAWFPSKLMPIIDMKLVIDNFCGIPLIRLCSQKYAWLFNKIKHGCDALITLPGFLLQLPLFLFIAAAIKLDSKGPVFYLAKAIGKNGKPFKMLKFRSMVINNDASIHKNYVTKLIRGEIGKKQNGDKPLKITDDPRVTRVGKILRKLSLDELPQLINVIKGEMSLVGPRPCLPYEYELYKDWHKKRTCVRPGITGLWQVAGRSDVDFEDMILLDLYYIYNRNIIMDLSVLYETFFTVMTKKGAY